MRDHGSGQLRIGSLSALGSSLVPKALARFQASHPDIAVTVIVAASGEIRDQVACGAFDLGLAADEIDTTGVQHQLFVAPDAVCALPAGHRLAAREVITPTDLDGEPFTAYVREDRARQRIDRIFEEAGVMPRIVVETIYAATVCAPVSEGLGIGLVSRYGAGGHDQSRLVLRPFEPAVPIRSLLILPPDRPKSELVRAMIDALMAAR
jgi:DNA-binding transcriptional LysR family regulator